MVTSSGSQEKRHDLRMAGERLRRRLIEIQWLRNLVQVFRVAASVRPTCRYLSDVVTGKALGQYQSRRTGEMFYLRPRLDLQVARELVSKDGYAPPPEISELFDGTSPRILDAGANIGLFSIYALRFFGADSTVLAVEPDPENLRLLNLNLAGNGCASRVQIEPAAMGTGPGSVRFLGGRRELSRIAHDDEYGTDVVLVPMVDFFDVVRDCDFVKLDIEGGEWQILRDERFRAMGAKAIAIEWHGLESGHEAPREEVEAIFRRAGYATRAEPQNSKDVGFIWAWRN